MAKRTPRKPAKKRKAKPQTKVIQCIECLEDNEVPADTKEDEFICELCEEDADIQDMAREEEWRQSLESMEGDSEYEE